MEIFVATSIKSIDLNPTHPGPLPRASFHTSAKQQIERSESKAARGRARSATDDVGDELQKSASGEQDELAGGKQHVAQEQRVAASFYCKNRRAATKTNWQTAGDRLQGQRVVASFCAQGARKLRPLRSDS